MAKAQKRGNREIRKPKADKPSSAAATSPLTKGTTLPSVDSPQPGGTYRLVMDEEEILGLSFLAFRRTATILHIPAISPAISISARPNQVFPVSSMELAAAMEADAQD
jgi:hypothetical protein